MHFYFGIVSMVKGGQLATLNRKWLDLGPQKKVLDEFKNILKIKVGETDASGKFSLASLRCVGACGLAPVALVGGKVYGRLAPDDIKKIISEYDDCDCNK